MMRLPKTHLPNVLVIYAKEDEVASLSSVRWLEKNWQSGQIQVILLDNSYHMITIDNDRALVCKVILDCLSAQPTFAST
jgi:carboxylesterase